MNDSQLPLSFPPRFVQLEIIEKRFQPQRWLTPVSVSVNGGLSGVHGGWVERLDHDVYFEQRRLLVLAATAAPAGQGGPQGQRSVP